MSLFGKSPDIPDPPPPPRPKPEVDPDEGIRRAAKRRKKATNRRNAIIDLSLPTQGAGLVTPASGGNQQ